MKRLFSSLLRKEAPDFRVKALMSDGNFSVIKRDDFSKNYWILMFYPLDLYIYIFSSSNFISTFVCPTEILAFNDRIDEFLSLNTVIMGVSVDSEWSHLKWSQICRAEGGLGPSLRIPLLSDIKKEMSIKYGVLDEESGIANRALFIVDPLMKIRHISMNDFSIGRNVDEVMRCLNAIQFVDKNGGSIVCPANWTLGKGIIETKRAEEYFKNVNK